MIQPGVYYDPKSYGMEFYRRPGASKLSSTSREILLSELFSERYVICYTEASRRIYIYVCVVQMLLIEIVH
jgi:hypothetical protein